MWCEVFTVFCRLTLGSHVGNGFVSASLQILMLHVEGHCEGTVPHLRIPIKIYKARIRNSERQDTSDNSGLQHNKRMCMSNLCSQNGSHTPKLSPWCRVVLEE
jgi:hypothetical protein